MLIRGFHTDITRWLEKINMYHPPFFFLNLYKVRHEKRRIYPPEQKKTSQKVPKLLDFFFVPQTKKNTHQPTKQEPHPTGHLTSLPHLIIKRPTTTNPFATPRPRPGRKSLIPRFTASNATPKNVMEALRLQGAEVARGRWAAAVWGLQGEFPANI